jgi:hypothetical protein
LYLTHPDQYLARICDDYVELIVALLTCEENTQPKDLIAATSQKSVSINLKKLVSKTCNDIEGLSDQLVCKKDITSEIEEFLETVK